MFAFSHFTVQALACLDMFKVREVLFHNGDHVLLSRIRLIEHGVEPEEQLFHPVPVGDLLAGDHAQGGEPPHIGRLRIREKFLIRFFPGGIGSGERNAAANGFYCFNIFVDLFLCTLVMYFLNARPKRFFAGKGILLFRLFTVIPVIYECVCMVIKIRTAQGRLVLSPYLYALLTVKPPMTFLLFVILAVFIKTRELRFLRGGRTQEEYRAFLGTNRNSLNFSVFLACMLAVISAVDQAAVSLLSETGTASGLQPVYRALGFGDSRWLFLLIPLVLLFSYTREPKRVRWNAAIPLTGFVLIILVYLQGTLQILHLVDLPKVHLNNYTPLIITYLNTISR